MRDMNSSDFSVKLAVPSFLDLWGPVAPLVVSASLLRKFRVSSASVFEGLAASFVVVSASFCSPLGVENCGSSSF